MLVNGRRIAPYGIGFTGDSVSVDVNSIPLAAIERVEVLKDGASAIYGSDAIAGVINFILRQDFKGIELTAEYGDTTQGGASFKRGHGHLRLRRSRRPIASTSWWSARYQKEGALFGRDRGFASTAQRRQHNDTTSGNTFPANIAPADGSGGHAQSVAPGLPWPVCAQRPAVPARPLPLRPVAVGDADAGRPSASASSPRGTFAITPDIQAYAEASYNRNKIRTVIQPVPLSDQFNIPLQNVALQPTAPYNSDRRQACVSTFLLTPRAPTIRRRSPPRNYGGTPDLLVRYRSALTGDRDFTDISEAPRFVAGVKGVACGWDFDVAFLYSQSKVREQVNDGFPLLTQLMPLLNSGNVNPFGPSDPAVEAAGPATDFAGDAYSIKSTLTSLAGKASRDVMQIRPARWASRSAARCARRSTTSPRRRAAGRRHVRLRRQLPADQAIARRRGACSARPTSRSSRTSRRTSPSATTTTRASAARPRPRRACASSRCRSSCCARSYGKGFRAPSLQDLYLPQQPA